MHVRTLHDTLERTEGEELGIRRTRSLARQICDVVRDPNMHPTIPMKAARAVVDPKRIALVVVGDRAKVETPLKALNLGAIRTLSVDDVMGKPPVLD